MPRNKKYILTLSFAVIVMFALTISCSDNYIPKPRGYFRISFPEKEYQQYQSDCNYSFEYPVYARIVPYSGEDAEPCWINIEFPGYKGSIYLTYKNLNKNLASYAEDIRTLAYKHIIKADDIVEHTFHDPDRDIYGVLYDIQGNTAASLSFFLTDSTDNFLSGSLYFNVVPNKDSLAPVIDFFGQDIIHLIETFSWN